MGGSVYHGKFYPGSCALYGYIVPEDVAATIRFKSFEIRVTRNPATNKFEYKLVRLSSNVVEQEGVLNGQWPELDVNSDDLSALKFKLRPEVWPAGRQRPSLP